jgi:hypothetical protein
MSQSAVRLSGLSLPLTVVVAGIVSLCSAWGAASVARYKLDDTARDLAEMKAKELPTAVEMQHVRDRLDGVERNQEQEKAALERIERRLGTR